jgi:DNA processing protein
VIGRRPPVQFALLTPQDPEYPAALRAIADPPQTLYVRGKLVEADRTAVAVVGSRRASPYGVAVAEWLGRELARNGVTVVSGLARGIDAAAHRGALQGGGRTIAVLGCGVDIIYPPEHGRLVAQITGAGAVLSEYPPGTPPLKHQFPRRNRLISGLALGVVVVEGREDSGALITADCALDQGREVFAVPGPVFAQTSVLPHRLLQQGAKLATTVEDILEELHLPMRPVLTPSVALIGAQAAVYAQLTLDPQHIDVVALRSGLPIAEVARTIVALELQGMVRALAGQRYVRATLEGTSSGEASG